MFRLIRLKPPHGWNAVAWELAIVTLGVLLALAAQQWADERTWRAKVETGTAALRDELSEHYSYAVEYRTVYPCVQAQLARLRERVLDSGSELSPAPLYHEPGDDFVVRIPSKEYADEAWDAAINDGIAHRLEPSLRRALAGHYAQLGSIRAMNSANDESEEALTTLAHRMPLDPMVRWSAVKEIEVLSGRLSLLDLLNEQAIGNIQKARMLPPPGDARVLTESYGTYKFCKEKALPMRSFSEAMRTVPG